MSPSLNSRPDTRSTRAAASMCKATRARHARPPHAACDNGGVAGHPAACGQNARGGVHAVNVFGAGFDADQNHALAHIVAAFGGVGVKDDLARCCAGRGWQALWSTHRAVHRDQALGAAIGQAPLDRRGTPPRPA